MALEYFYDGTLGGLFALLDRLWTEAPAEGPRRVRRQAYPGGSGSPQGRENPQAGLFDADFPGGAEENSAASGDSQSAAGPGSFRTPPGLLPEPAALDGAAGILFQVSADAYDALVYAWMNAFPLEAPALRYALKVLAAAKEAVLVKPAGDSPWYARSEAREGAAAAARNRGGDDCRTVLEASYKVAHEIDRLRGFLRFMPDGRGRYAARCAPDHFVLPALAPHFTRRFGDTPWAVIDERRGLALVMEGEARIVFAGEDLPLGEDSGRESLGAGDPWEKLWRSYHRTINIGARKNLSLQRQFVPLRYREYLTEFDPD
jgi:hypothetical protein